MNSPLSKTALRQSLRQARDRFVRGLAPAERGSLQQEAARRLEAVLGDGAWASYVAIGSEIDPSPLATLAAPGRVIAYPWFENRDAPMIFRSGQGSLQPGPFGISQPDAGNPSRHAAMDHRAAGGR
jgi:5-formyltetrahydrofolate cyclo-ligase